MLEANGISSNRIYTQEVMGNHIFPDEQFDFIVSLISWGFHYPVETYLDKVYDLMKLGGKLIIDIRKGSSGEKLIKQKFGSIQVLKDTQKSRRILVQKYENT